MRRLLAICSLLLPLFAVPAGAEEPGQGAHGLRLPASFTGTLPCADCEGIRHHLDLWPDQSFALRLEWLGGGAPSLRDDLGHWHVDPARRALILTGGGEMPLQWQIRGDGGLHALDMAGEPIVSDLPYDLTPGPLVPTPLALPMRGMFQYMADAAVFTECLSGQRFPVVMEGAYLDLERAYLAAGGAPGAPLMAALEGRIEERPAMEGPPRRQLLVDRLAGLAPDETCPPAAAPAALINTYWRLVRLGATALPEAAGREPYLVLLPGEAPRFSATLGCNMMNGSYQLDGATLVFGPAASTMMACPPPLDALEPALGQALAATARWDSDGKNLRLLDAGGQVLVELAAVYAPR